MSVHDGDYVTGDRVCTLGLLKIVTEEEHELENPGK